MTICIDTPMYRISTLIFVKPFLRSQISEETNIALCGISASILRLEHSVSYEDSFPADDIFVDMALDTGETLLHGF